MRIVEVAPPWFPIPPVAYGGIERVVYDLVEGLTAEGHEVTLLAPGGSRTSARLIPIVERGLGLDLASLDKHRLMCRIARDAYRIAADLGADLVHDHGDIPVPDGFPIPVVRTLHGPAVDAAVDGCRALSERGDRFVAISRRQRELYERAARERHGPGARLAIAGVVHNPIDVSATPFYDASRKEPYAAFVGRCHWEKDPAAAIRIARRAGVPLKMALRVASEERPYFDAVVRPLIEANRGLVEYLGEVGGAAKHELLDRAAALLFTSPWEEPFGLVLTEAGAHGTPVVALRRGSVPEIIVDGVTGFACRDEEEMARRLPEAMGLDPRDCRAHVAANFDRPIIARRYLDLFRRVAAPATISPVPADLALAAD